MDEGPAMSAFFVAIVYLVETASSLNRIA